MKKLSRHTIWIFVIITASMFTCCKKSENLTGTNINQEKIIVENKPEKKEPKFSLNWEYFNENKAVQKKIEECTFIDDLRFMVLFYDLLEKQPEKQLVKLFESKKNPGFKNELLAPESVAKELAYYFPEIDRAGNEFQRKEIINNVVEKIKVLRSEVTNQKLYCCRIADIGISDYDFDKKGFVFEEDGTINNYALFDDKSTYAINATNIINSFISEKTGYYYTMFTAYINFSNKSDKNLFKKILSVDKNIAEANIHDFRYKKTKMDEKIAENMGINDYKGRRVVDAYVIIDKLIEAKPEKSRMGGEIILGKNIYGSATDIIFYNQKNLVLSVLSSQAKQ